MSHEPKSPSLGMISTATRTTATVSPLAPSPIGAALVANGSPAPQSAHSGFAAALRKLAKQAEEPRGPASISGESSPVSSPATNHNSPAGTPKRVALGAGTLTGAQAGAHSVSSTPPVVTIAPTKTVNGLWRSEGRQAEATQRLPSRDRVASEHPPPHHHHHHHPATQDKSPASLPAHLMGTPFPFGLSPSAVMQDPRLQALNLSRQVPHILPSGAAVPEEYLRSGGFRPYGSAEELRVPSLPLGLDPGTAAAAAAYFHSGYLAHPALSSYRMDESLCLSALRSPFYQLPAGGAALPSLHPSAAHLHLPGVRYPADLTHPALTALQSERLQMEDKLRQREREREREKERAQEAEREKEREREREREQERERERERERELERQKERAKEREVHAVQAMEKHSLSHELHTHSHALSHRQHAEERARLVGRLTPNRPEKTKEASILAPKPLQPGVYPSLAGHGALSAPGLVASPGRRVGLGAGAVQGTLAAVSLLQRHGDEERWLARQGRLRDREERQGHSSELCPEPGRSNEPQETHRDLQRPTSYQRDLPSRDLPHHLGAPPPLISPKPPHRQQQQQHHHHPHPPPPPNPPPALWNPASLIDSPSHMRRGYDPPKPPPRPPPGLTKPERFDEGNRRPENSDRGPPLRAHALLQPSAFVADLEKSHLSILKQQKVSLALPGPCGDQRPPKRAGSPIRTFPQGPCKAPQPMLVYDQVLQQHRTLLSKLDLEEKRRREAREKGYYYELDDSYDESDEEEVRAHLRRVAEQPPLKLDQSKEKLDFLSMVGLTSLPLRDEVLERKRRKRRRMMKERSPSPPPVQGKRRAVPPPTPALTTQYTAEEMDKVPEIEDKKHFLIMFSLNHVTQEQRIEKEKVENLLEAIKQKTVTLDTLRYATHTHCSSPSSAASVQADPSAPSTPCQLNGTRHPSPRNASSPTPHKHPNSNSPADAHRSPSDPPRPPKEPPPLAPLQEQARYGEAHPIRRPPGPHSGPRPSFTPLKERLTTLNGLSGARPRPWESLSPEEFAQQFHQSVLQSTQKTQHKHKGLAEQNHKFNNSMHYNPPDQQGAPNILPYSHTNGHSCHQPAARKEPSGLGDELSVEDESCEEEDEEEEEEDEQDEDESYSPKWKGIEAVLEAYQEYAEERNTETEVLQSECRRLETQHYHLSVTADQLSLTMTDLLAQRQRLALERERMQSELEHFRMCLALPALHLHRGHYKGPPPR